MNYISEKIDECSGTGAFDFLQGLVSNDMTLVNEGSDHDAIHTSMMNNKGRMIFDMLVMKGSDEGECVINIYFFNSKKMVFMFDHSKKLRF